VNIKPIRLIILIAFILYPSLLFSQNVVLDKIVKYLGYIPEDFREVLEKSNRSKDQIIRNLARQIDTHNNEAYTLKKEIEESQHQNDQSRLKLNRSLKENKGLMIKLTICDSSLNKCDDSLTSARHSRDSLNFAHTQLIKQQEETEHQRIQERDTVDMVRKELERAQLMCLNSSFQIKAKHKNRWELLTHEKGLNPKKITELKIGFSLCDSSFAENFTCSIRDARNEVACSSLEQLTANISNGNCLIHKTKNKNDSQWFQKNNTYHLQLDSNIPGNKNVIDELNKLISQHGSFSF
jgi:hypothetical protein